MRQLVVGDIHGCFHALRTLIDVVPFSPVDRIITLGDYVDRGPDSYAVLEWLIHLHQRGQLVPLRGNHEVMMLEARNGKTEFKTWVRYGGDATLASYSPMGDAGRLADIPDSHWYFLDNELLPYYQTQSHFFVHANAHPDLPLNQQPDLMLYWQKLDAPKPHGSGKVMVCGHTPQKTGLPSNFEHAICIDTWAYSGGWLTCLDVASGQFWQANQQGEYRLGQLQSLASLE